MAIFRDYNGNPITIPTHKHSISDTKNSSNNTAIATTTEGGFMSKEMKNKLDTLKTRVATMNEKLTSGTFIKTKSSTLVAGSTFKSTVSSMITGSIVFTDSVIPASSIASAKVVSVSGSEVTTYAYTLNNILYISPAQENTIIYANENCSNMFNNTAVTSIDFANFDTTNTKNMSGMFGNCAKLTNIIFSNRFNTSLVTNMSSMFYGDTGLSTIKFNSKFNTSSVTNMTDMFFNCQNLQYVNLENFSFKSATTLTRMFQLCIKLQAVIVIDKENIQVYTQMLMNCAIEPGSHLIIDYKRGCETMAQDIFNSMKASTNYIKLGQQVY